MDFTVRFKDKGKQAIFDYQEADDYGFASQKDCFTFHIFLRFCRRLISQCLRSNLEHQMNPKFRKSYSRIQSSNNERPKLFDLIQML